MVPARLQTPGQNAATPLTCMPLVCYGSYGLPTHRDINLTLNPRPTGVWTKTSTLGATCHFAPKAPNKLLGAFLVKFVRRTWWNSTIRLETCLGRVLSV